MSRFYGSLQDAVEDGALFALPEEIELGHAQAGRHCIVALAPMDLGASDGSARHLEPGDLLSADEVRHGANAVHVLLRAGRAARLPVDRGVVALALAGRT